MNILILPKRWKWDKHAFIGNDYAFKYIAVDINDIQNLPRQSGLIGRDINIALTTDKSKIIIEPSALSFINTEGYLYPECALHKIIEINEPGSYTYQLPEDPDMSFPILVGYYQRTGAGVIFNKIPFTYNADTRVISFSLSSNFPAPQTKVYEGSTVYLDYFPVKVSGSYTSVDELSGIVVRSSSTGAISYQIGCLVSFVPLKVIKKPVVLHIEDELSDNQFICLR